MKWRGATVAVKKLSPNLGNYLLSSAAPAGLQVSSALNY